MLSDDGSAALKNSVWVISLRGPANDCCILSNPDISRNGGILSYCYQSSGIDIGLILVLGFFPES